MSIHRLVGGELINSNTRRMTQFGDLWWGDSQTVVDAILFGEVSFSVLKLKPCFFKHLKTEFPTKQVNEF